MEKAVPVDFPSDDSRSDSYQNHAEAALVVRAQAGQTEAFDTLMRTYRDRVFGVVFGLTGNRADASDVTQDVFIKAFTNIRKYNFRSSFFTWIYRIAVNEALNYQRRARSKKMNLFEKFLPSKDETQTQEERLAKLAALNNSDARPESTLQNEMQTQLDKSLQELSEEHRAALVLVEIEGLPLQEAAEILGASVGTVKSRLHYAKKRLQTLLKPYLNL